MSGVGMIADVFWKRLTTSIVMCIPCLVAKFLRSCIGVRKLFRSRYLTSLLQSKPFAFPFFAAGVGISLDGVFDATLQVVICIALTFLALVVIGCLSKYRCVTLLALLGATAGVFAVRHHMQWNSFFDDQLALYAPQDSVESIPVCVEVVAHEQPKILASSKVDPLSTVPLSDKTRFLVRVQRIRNGSRWSSASGFANLNVNGHLLSVKSGDRLQIFAKLKKIRPATNPGEFDFQKHARAERRLCQLHAPYPDCVTLLKRAESAGFHQSLQRLRGRWQRTFERYLAPSNSELASALLLGQRDQLPRDHVDDFFLTGTMHLLAISGLHVGILAFGFFFVARRGLVSYRVCLVAAMVFVLVYAFLTDAKPPVLRAAILIQVICLSWWFRRKANVYNSLFFAGLLVLAWNPMELFRVGAQLSFLAVGALCWFSQIMTRTVSDDPLDRLIWRTRPWYQKTSVKFVQWMRQMLVASAVVWLATLPLTMARFHIVSPYSVFLNLILIVPISIALFSGLSLLILADLFPWFANSAALFCNLSLQVIREIVAFVRPLPGSHFWVAGPSEFRLGLFYVFAAIFVVLPYRNLRWWSLLVAAWYCYPSVSMLPEPPEKDRVDVTFIDVGHGTSVLMELPDHRVILYDCGQLGISRSVADSISSVLWNKRITYLDAVVLSHADADHFNALPNLIDRFRIGVILVGDEMFKQPSKAVVELQRSIKRHAIPLQIVGENTQIRTGHPHLSLSFLHPAKSSSYQSDNEKSLVLSLDYADSKLLLPGDLEAIGMEHFLMRPMQDYDVVMAPHHGSLRSAPSDFVRRTKPEATVISSGYRVDSERSLLEYRRLGQDVWFTGKDGAIFLRLDRGRETQISSFLRE